MRSMPVLFCLCLCAAANAGFSLHCLPELAGPMQPTVSVVSVFSDSEFMPTPFWLTLEANGDFGWSLPFAPDPFTVEYSVIGSTHFWFVNYQGAYIPELPNPGLLLQIGFTFAEPGSSFEMAVLQMDGQMNDSRTFSIVPEPATMLLLTLGAVCLRRK